MPVIERKEGRAVVKSVGDIKAQTKECLDKLDKLLEEVGGSKSRVIEARIWLKDIGRDFGGMNEEYKKWLDEDKVLKS